MDHPEEVVWVTFPARDDAARIMKPSEQAFDLPATARATQRAPVLSEHPTVWSMRRDHFNVVPLAQMAIERITIVPAIPDQTGRERFEEPRGEGGVDEAGFMWRSAGHVEGERKTMAVADRHDFAALTASSRANGGAPFFAELKLASMKASLRSSFPRSRRSSASPCNTRSSKPLRCQA